MSKIYVVIHKNNKVISTETKHKLEKIIEDRIKTHEEYFCCDTEEQTCYIQGTLEECQKFLSQQDDEVQTCMEIKVCNVEGKKC